MSKSGTYRITETAARVVLGLWAGSLWTVGYLAAPALFSVIENTTLAGTVAGRLFFAESVLSVICASLILVPGLLRDGLGMFRSGLSQLVLATVLLVSASQWGVRPWIEASRLTDGTPGPGFALAHGVAAVLYLLASLAALAALWRSARGPA